MCTLVCCTKAKVFLLLKFFFSSNKQVKTISNQTTMFTEDHLLIAAGVGAAILLGWHLNVLPQSATDMLNNYMPAVITSAVAPGPMAMPAPMPPTPPGAPSAATPPKCEDFTTQDQCGMMGSGCEWINDGTIGCRSRALTTAETGTA